MGEIVDLAERREQIRFIRQLADAVVAECRDEGIVIDAAVRVDMRWFIIEKTVERFGGAA